jgi:hypothetical protein
VLVSKSGMENGRFLLPEAVAAQLTAEGYIRSAEEELGKADVGMIVLTVYNTASATVTLFQTPGVIRALAASLRRWFRREKDAKPDYQFEMTARGPLGYIDFKSDEAPSTDALVQFLEENVWGDAAPPDTKGHNASPPEIEGHAPPEIEGH